MCVFLAILLLFSGTIFCTKLQQASSDASVEMLCNNDPQQVQQFEQLSQIVRVDLNPSSLLFLLCGAPIKTEGTNLEAEETAAETPSDTKEQQADTSLEDSSQTLEETSKDQRSSEVPKIEEEAETETKPMVLIRSKARRKKNKKGSKRKK